MRAYSFSGIIYLAFSIAYTKLICRRARLIRFPADIRRKRGIEFGNNLTVGYFSRLETHGMNNQKVLIIGNNVQLNDFVHIAAKESVSIGDNVLIASKVFITDILHGSYKGCESDSNPNTPPVNRELSSLPVRIDDNVWIGEFVSILPGCTIGKGSIIGSNTVVTKDIPPYSIAAGNPARVIKKYNFTVNRWEKI